MSGKRIIPATKRAEITVMDTVDSLMEKSVGILMREIQHLEISAGNKVLDDKQVKKLVQYTNLVINLSKERREIDKSLDIGDMTKDEAIKYLKNYIKQLEERK